MESLTSSTWLIAEAKDRPGIRCSSTWLIAERQSEARDPVFINVADRRVTGRRSAQRKMEAMAAVERAIAAANQRAVRMIVDLGREIHNARLTRALSQNVVADAVGVSQGLLSAIERGLDPGVPVATLARVCAALGLELSMRAFPAGQPIRDAAHIALLERFRKTVGETWRWAAEVPLPIQGDRRAWDRLLRGPDMSIGVEAEMRPTDMQELGRRVALKRRDGGVDRVMLVLADTEWCRRMVRLNDLGNSFPVPGRDALSALAAGRDPGGDAIILI